MQEIRPEGWLSIREAATLWGLSEMAVRRMVGAQKLDCIKVGQRQWINPAETSIRFVDELTSPWTRDQTVAKLVRNAAAAGVEVDPQQLVIDAEAYMRALHPNVDTPEGPVAKQMELAAI